MFYLKLSLGTWCFFRRKNIGGGGGALLFFQKILVGGCWFIFTPKLLVGFHDVVKNFNGWCPFFVFIKFSLKTLLKYFMVKFFNVL